MAARHRQTVRTWVAVFAAYLTALQLVLGGALPLRAAFDPMAVLCTHAGPAAPAGPAPHHHPDDCCGAGCPMAAALPGRAPEELAGGADALGTAPALRPVPADLDRRPTASPRRTRGPPVTA